MRSATSCSRSTIKVEKLPEAYEREFFPAKTPFSKTYSVRVRRARGAATSPASSQVRSSFASPVPIGRVELTWRA